MAVTLLYPSYGNAITDERGVPNVAFYRWMENITARVGRGSESTVDVNFDELSFAPLPTVTSSTSQQSDDGPVCGCHARVERLERMVAALMAEPTPADPAAYHALQRRMSDLELDA